MKKVAIITHYNDSNNFGGLLQAYALTEYLNSEGVDCKQICFNFKSNYRKLQEDRCEHVPPKKIKIYRNSHYQNHYFDKRFDKIADFKKKIPHTKDIYKQDNMVLLNEFFDIFITGSDQVFNPNWYCPEFYLSFVNKKKKVAYAASLGVNKLSAFQEKIIGEHLESFDYISVREVRAEKIIKKLTQKSVAITCDPVLLLEQKHWDSLAIKPKTSQKYIFTYFLGTFIDNRNIAKELAKKLSIPIINIPFPLSRFNNVDRNFSTNKVKNAGPLEFLGLIKYSEYVITDSFHAVLFSIIFKKQFFVLKRNSDANINSMNSRIVNILNKINLPCKLINNITDLENSEIYQKIEYPKTSNLLTPIINKSKIFIKKVIINEND